MNDGFEVRKTIKRGVRKKNRTKVSVPKKDESYYGDRWLLEKKRV